jgi:hypothetical protein
MCLRICLPAKLDSCTLQMFVISISQNSYICFRIVFFLLVKQPIHERTVRRAPARETTARCTHAQYQFWKNIKWPRSQLHKGTPVAKRLRLLYQFWKALTIPAALCPYMSWCMAKCNLSVCLTHFMVKNAVAYWPAYEHIANGITLP